EMAADHGIGGFCYYHYWFNGRKLLERPFDEVLASGAPDFPFCLCWANGNWTRRWDGREHDVLMAQDYSRYDPQEHLRWLAPAFADPRYVTIQSRPLFLVYDAASIPALDRVIGGWREAAVRIWLADPYLCGVFTPGSTLTYDDFMVAGFDAVTEFFPTGRRPLSGVVASVADRPGVQLLRRLRTRVRNSPADQSGPAIHSYEILVANAMASRE